jgi:hypothetical protein
MVAALPLGGVERCVRAIEHADGRAAVAHREADGDREETARAVRVRDAHLGHRRADALGHGEGLLAAGARQHEQDLLAAVAVGDVGLAQRVDHALRHAHERLVAREMALAVVVGLEAVEVAERDRVRMVARATTVVELA